MDRSRTHYAALTQANRYHDPELPFELRLARNLELAKVKGFNSSGQQSIVALYCVSFQGSSVVTRDDRGELVEGMFFLR